MSKLTALKKQIAALEAQAERIAKQETGSAIAKVKDIMAEFNLTIEHLTQTVAGKRAAKKTKVKSASVAKYADPKSGKTWSGFGRAPGWIASAKNRDAFLVGKSAAGESDTPKSAAAQKATPKVAKAAKVTKAAVKSAAKKATGVKMATAVEAEPVAAKKKRVAKKAAPAANKASTAEAAPATAKKKPAAKKPPAKKSTPKKSAPQPAAAVEAAAAPAA